MPSLISAQKLLDCTKFTCENPQVSSDTNRAIEKVNLTLDSEYKGSKTGKKSECINSVESALTVDQRPFVEFGMGSGCFDATAENQIQDGVVVAMLKIDPKIVQFYKGDVITHDQCYTEDAVIYNVAVTGYNRVGVKGSQPFWQVRMSFGDTWGIKGTMRIQKTNDSKTYIMVDCGLRRDFYFPEMKKY